MFVIHIVLFVRTRSHGFSFAFVFSVHPVLESVHRVRPAAGVRLHTENAIERSARHFHTEPSAVEFRRQPYHLLFVFHAHLQISQVEVNARLLTTRVSVPLANLDFNCGGKGKGEV